MKRYDTLPIADLKSDVATDAAHVKELADSIKVSGPIAPVLVREETGEIIDGFHRVAAMAELGFEKVECIITSCEDEEFWDLRIMSATLHKAVTFARAVEWIEFAFQSSPWTERYKNAESLFVQCERRQAPKEVQEWGQAKAAKWGLAVGTINNWLSDYRRLAPDLRPTSASPPTLSTQHLSEIAAEVDHETQRRLAKKAEEEALSTRQMREVVKAVKAAADSEEVATVLREPVAKSSEDLGRAAKVEKILRKPTVSPFRQEAEREIQESASLARLHLMLIEMAALADQLDNDTLGRLTAPRLDETVQLVDTALGKLLSLREKLKHLKQQPQLKAVE